MRRLLILTAALAVAAALGASVSASASGGTVAVKDNRFAPKSITIHKGGTLTWKWRGRNLHNVTGPGFHSKDQSNGTYRHTFRKKGTFTIVCTLHLQSSNMKMTVKVV
jgi:plastocyanin